MTTITRNYVHQFDLKYGCNPHQSPSAIFSLADSNLPFQILNGKPGYINLLDALNAWQLVRELDKLLDAPAATSFKHVSPAGAAVAVPLSPVLQQVYECAGQELSPLATAYIRARGADPMSSFGDFIALSRVVDEATAQVIKSQVSDGVIAPGYEPKALEILKSKKNGGYVVLQANLEATAPEQEYREVFGVVFSQRTNHIELNSKNLLENVVTKATSISETARRDLILAAVTIKYTQSNSVGYALDGQMIGIGAGQQSRIDCTKLAGKKAEMWFLRQHPKVLELPFKADVKKVDRVNARVLFIENEMTDREQATWQENFVSLPNFLTSEERLAWISSMNGVSLASDAFFPFRDNIDQASRRGVSYIVQAGGSVRDDDVIQAANEYGMTMAFSKIRLFHH
ncbi:MAG: phosphoribosylaminoimidazolecarboxamide formyltransferase [SAR324 cluster bacterium]|nr:phosphoribosylaminoimidazolecarboxamide formyltransferase [SAR324 cluster bacterium]MBF0349775.1 phosphoribosylaminoimidazolecarboxamide formyltransferase [SAR324 cluster bacterium]